MPPKKKSQAKPELNFQGPSENFGLFDVLIAARRVVTESLRPTPPQEDPRDVSGLVQYIEGPVANKKQPPKPKQKKQPQKSSNQKKPVKTLATTSTQIIKTILETAPEPTAAPEPVPAIDTISQISDEELAHSYKTDSDDSDNSTESLFRFDDKRGKYLSDEYEITRHQRRRNAAREKPLKRRIRMQPEKNSLQLENEALCEKTGVAAIGHIQTLANYRQAWTFEPQTRRDNMVARIKEWMSDEAIKVDIEKAYEKECEEMEDPNVDFFQW